MSEQQARDLVASWQSLSDMLAVDGINLSAVLDCQTLNRETDIAAIPSQGRLLVFAAGGRSFWGRMRTAREADGQFSSPDPDAADHHVVDDYCRQLLMRALSSHLNKFETQILYPGDCHILLPALGEFLGWSSRSPLGLGIHEQYGLWWAYRALCWTDAPIPFSSAGKQASSPCSSCLTTPCVDACPVGAVSATDSFDLSACAEFRTRSDSVCVDRCLARLACPVAPDQRQDLEQHQYHQQRALVGLKSWLKNASEVVDQ